MASAFIIQFSLIIAVDSVKSSRSADLESEIHYFMQNQTFIQFRCIMKTTNYIFYTSETKAYMFFEIGIGRR